MNLLLLSNSTNFGESYMDWCYSTIGDFLVGAKDNVLFIPYAAASFSFEEYTQTLNGALSKVGVKANNIDSYADPVKAVRDATAILVGGGNTFHLLYHLQKKGLMEPIRERVMAGIRYVGWSAGSNVAGPTLCTTNDMPIIEPESFNALALIDKQINPHYTEERLPNHGGESRFQRLVEFLAVNPQSEVICLPEASYLIQQGDDLRYVGGSGAKVLTRMEERPLMEGIVT